MKAMKRSSIAFRYLTANFRILPSFIIAGFPRCGTTSLYNYLIEHPSIVSALTKEIRFFGQNYVNGFNWYKLFFPTIFSKFKINKKFRKNFMTGEASATYVHHPLTPIRIKKVLPEIKIIILLRNPVERAFSQYFKTMKLGREPLTFDQAIEEENKRLEGEWESMSKEENYYSEKYHNYSYLTAGMYIDKLKPWFDTFNDDQILILQSEDLYDDPQGIFNDTLKFLNLPSYKLPKFERYNFYEDKPMLDDNTRKKLDDFFRLHNERLYKFLGRNFHW